MIAGRLTMRAKVERSALNGMDAYGHPVAPAFVPFATVRCFAWTPKGRDLIDGNKVAVQEDVRILLPITTTVLETDRVAEITDKAGAVLFPGPFRIEGPVQYKHTHREAALVRVS